jgi:CysZ protein
MFSARPESASNIVNPSDQRLGFLAGLKAAGGGIVFVVSTPSIWPYALVPVGLMLILGCGLGGLGVWGASLLTDALLGEHLEGWSRFGAALLTIAFSLLALALSFFLALLLTQPLSGSALEAIASAQEHKLTGKCCSPPSFLAALLESLRIAGITAVIAIALFVVFFLIDVIIPFAAVVTIPARFFTAAWLLAWDFLDYPLSLRGIEVGQRWRWLRQHAWGVTGFGLAWAALLLIPGIFLIVLPMGVAGATRLVVAADDAPRQPDASPRGQAPSGAAIRV